MVNWGLLIAVASLAALVALALAIILWRQQADIVNLRREKHIRAHVFSDALIAKLKTKHPQLELKDCHLVARGPREFFLAYLRSGRQFVGMPSRVVDDLWHEFILDTHEYGRFCAQAFGGYFHHSPAASMGKTAAEDAGLRRTWRYVCVEENIDWRRPTRLPLLYAIDEKLKIAFGRHYNLEQQRATFGAANAGMGCGGGGCGGGCGGC